MRRHIPNIITLLNLLSGCIGIIMVFSGDLILGSAMIGLGVLLDYFDGFVARALDSRTNMGKDLDSLADVVTFGVLPGFIIFNLILQDESNPNAEFLAFAGLLIPLFSAWRLARFNNDPRQSDIFYGLPTPANAILIGSYPLILQQDSSLVPLHLDFIHYLLSNGWMLAGYSLVLSIMLVSEIPLFSLKFSSTDFSENAIRYLFIIISLVLLIMFYYAAMPPIIILYIILSVIRRRSIEAIQ